MKLSMWKLLITVLIIATEFVNGRDRGRRLFSIRSSGGSRSGSEDGGVVTSSRSVLDPFLDLSWPGAGLSEALRLLDSSLSLGEGVLTEAGPLLQWARQSVLMPVDTEETDKVKQQSTLVGQFTLMNNVGNDSQNCLIFPKKQL